MSDHLTLKILARKTQRRYDIGPLLVNPRPGPPLLVLHHPVERGQIVIGKAAIRKTVSGTNSTNLDHPQQSVQGFGAGATWSYHLVGKRG